MRASKHSKPNQWAKINDQHFTNGHQSILSKQWKRREKLNKIKFDFNFCALSNARGQCVCVGVCKFTIACIVQLTINRYQITIDILMGLMIRFGFGMHR